ncbi:MAG TPA: hypothetical protein VF676_04745 [Flavobacterium sp.]|jgi:transposase-like protein
MNFSELITATDLKAIQDNYPNDRKCDEYLHATRWKDGVVSPFDLESKVYECRGGRYRCKNTKKYFNVRTKTLFHNSKVPLSVWFQAIWIISNSSKITSVALAKELNLTQKTAWFMLRRINRYLDQSGLRPKNRKPFESVTKANEASAPPADALPLTEWLRLLKNKQ